MTITLTEQETALVVEAIDVGLKAYGLAAVVTALNAAQALEKAVHVDEETKDRTYELTDEQNADIRSMLNLTIKLTGLEGGGAAIAELAKHFESKPAE